MKLTYFGEQAISVLRPNGKYAIQNGVLDYQDNDRPEDLAITQKANELKAEYDAQEYARNRAIAYPSLADQADMQYHDSLNSTTTWKDAIAKVKSDNPKPS